MLKDLVESGDANFDQIDDDLALDPLRDDASFVDLTKTGRSGRRYSAVWVRDDAVEATAIYGIDPEAHRHRSSELAAKGYRPVAWSAARVDTAGPMVTASVWHRPVIPEEVKDRLAERQARAAVALVRLGRAESVWPLLRHSGDPRSAASS